MWRLRKQIRRPNKLTLEFWMQEESRCDDGDYKWAHIQYVPTLMVSYYYVMTYLHLFICHTLSHARLSTFLQSAVSRVSELAVAVRFMVGVPFAMAVLCLPEWIYDKHSWNHWCDILGTPLPLVFTVGWVTGGLSAAVEEAPAVTIWFAGVFLSARACCLSAYKCYIHKFSGMCASLRTLSLVVFTHGFGLTPNAVPEVGGFPWPVIVGSFHPDG